MPRSRAARASAKTVEDIESGNDVYYANESALDGQDEISFSDLREKSGYGADVPLMLIRHAEGSNLQDSAVTKSNYDAFRERAEGDKNNIWLVSGGHGSYGIAVGLDIDDPEIIGMIEALEQYPVLDESAMSELETERQDEAWDDWARHEFTRAVESKFQDMVDEDGEPFEYDGDNVVAIFGRAMERANVYWHEDSDGSQVVDMDRIVAAVTADDVGAREPESDADPDATAAAERERDFQFDTEAAGQRRLKFDGLSGRRSWREGTVVHFNPSPVSLQLYSQPRPKKGDRGVVVGVNVGRGNATYIPGPGGGLVYVDWETIGVMGTAPQDLEVESSRS